jgi:hypothetical protein
VKSNEPIDAQYVGCRVCLMVRIEKSLKRFYGYLSRVIDGQPQIDWDDRFLPQAQMAFSRYQGDLYIHI